MPSTLADHNARVARAVAKVKADPSPKSLDSLRRARNRRSAYNSREKQKLLVERLTEDVQRLKDKLRDVSARLAFAEKRGELGKCGLCGSLAPCCFNCVKALVRSAAPPPEPLSLPKKDDQVDIGVWNEPIPLELADIYLSPPILTFDDTTSLQLSAQACMRELALAK